MTSETAIDHAQVAFNQWLHGWRDEGLSPATLSVIEDAFRFAWLARWEHEKAKMLDVLARNINST